MEWNTPLHTDVNCILIALSPFRVYAHRPCVASFSRHPCVPAKVRCIFLSHQASLAPQQQLSFHAHVNIVLSLRELHHTFHAERGRHPLASLTVPALSTLLKPRSQP